MRTTTTWLVRIFSVAAVLMPALAQAAESESAAVAGGGIGAALAIGAAAFGGSLGQGKTAAAALEGLSRNPQAKLFGPMIIGLALIESLVLYAFVIAFVKIKI